MVLLYLAKLVRENGGLKIARADSFMRGAVDLFYSIVGHVEYSHQRSSFTAYGHDDHLRHSRVDVSKFYKFYFKNSLHAGAL